MPNLSVATRLKKYGLILRTPLEEKEVARLRKIFTTKLEKLKSDLSKIDIWYREMPTGQGLGNISSRLRPADCRARTTGRPPEFYLEKGALRSFNLTFDQVNQVRTWRAAEFENATYEEIAKHLSNIERQAENARRPYFPREELF